MTTDHSTITCSCRMGQKGDLCAPKIAAIMKLQKCPAARRFAWESRSQKFPKLLDLKRLIIRLKGAKIPKFHGPFLAYLKQSRVDCYSNTVGIHAHSPSMFTLVTRHSSTFARFECIPRVVNASCALGTRFPTSVSARDAKISHARRHPLGNTQR